MRTARALTMGGYLPGGVPARGCLPRRCTCSGGACPGGVLAPGVYLPRGYLPSGNVPDRGVYMPRGYLPREGDVPAQVLPLPREQNDRQMQNITLPQTSFAGGKKGVLAYSEGAQIK